MSKGTQDMNWKEQLKTNITEAKDLAELLHLSDNETEQYHDLLEKYPMTVTDYYLSLINWEDKNDPIRKMCLPSLDEFDTDGSLDTSGEASNTVIEGLQHKYKQTALILSTNICAMYCRHCFRKRLVGLSGEEILKEYPKIVEYIKEHKEISNVLISGGDAFINETSVIEAFLKPLAELDNLDFIRFGTRTPVVFPQRITDDKELVDILRKYNERKQIMVVTQFNHPNEFTPEAVDSINKLRNAGLVIKNQTVLLKGINDNPEVLSTLLRKLTSVGIVPYYVFQCRPVTGVKHQFQVPIKKAVNIINETRSLLNGQAKCFRYGMSHPLGKIEIIDNLSDGTTLFRFHQAKYDEYNNKLFAVNLGDDQCWLEDNIKP